MIETYLEHLRVERRLADHTLDSYSRDLRGLVAFAAAQERAVEALDRRALEAFVRQQRTAGLSPRSVARSIAAIRGFYRFLVLDKQLAENPADDLRPPKAWPALPKFLSPEEVDQLIAQPDVTSALGLRDRAMLELLYATGMRVSELVKVRAVDLRLDEEYLTCVGKGNKERIIPIGEQATTWVRRYQHEGRSQLIAPRKGTRRNRVAAPVSERARRLAVARRLLEDSQSARTPRGNPRGAEPARDPSLLRHAPARARRRSSRDPDDARTRRPFDDADLHSRARGTAAERSTTAFTRAPDLLVNLTVSP